jgi:hypothetical protein
MTVNCFSADSPPRKTIRLRVRSAGVVCHERRRRPEDAREDDVAEIFVALEMPTELGRSVISSPAVRSSVDECPYARIVSRAASQDSEGAHRDFGSASLLLLGTPSAVAAVTGLFAVIRTMIKEAHITIRDRQSQQYDLQRLVLVLGARREEIDLARDLKEIEARLDELQHQTSEKLSP